MRAYRQRSGAVLAMVLFAAAAATPVTPKSCAGAKSCGQARKPEQAKQPAALEEKQEPPKQEEAAPDAHSPEPEPESQPEVASEPEPQAESQLETASAPESPEAPLTPEPPTVMANEPAAEPAPPPAVRRAAPVRPAVVRAPQPRRVLPAPAPRPAVAQKPATPPKPAPVVTAGGLLQVASPKDITPAVAETMLKQTGYWRPGGNMTQALSAMETGYNEGAPTVGALDDATRAHLFQEYQLYSAARRYYAAYPEISARATPQLFEKWVREAAAQMTSIPAAQRIPLLKAATMQESGQVHWVNFRPTMSKQGAIGFGQALASKGRSFGYNPYDPGRNILLMARALDTAYRTEGSIHNALGRYNGGPDWRGKGESQAYARNILVMMLQYS